MDMLLAGCSLVKLMLGPEESFCYHIIISSLIRLPPLNKTIDSSFPERPR